MNILLTGASSFTGYWFVRTLAGAGHDVVCPIRGNLADYEGIRATRLRNLESICRLVPLTLFGSEDFIQLAGSRPFDVFCHHAADVGSYKNPGFDVENALRNNVYNLPAVLSALGRVGARSVVITGTYFEENEGAGSFPLRTFSAYSLSKTLTYETFQTGCREAGLTLGKFVIPNPFGPYEDEKFTAYLMRQWKSGCPASVRTPEYLRDNIHVDLLARVYEKFVGDCFLSGLDLLKVNPSGYVGRQIDFARRVSDEVRSRLGWTCAIQESRQEDFDEPMARFNTDPAEELVANWDEGKAWDMFARHYGRDSGGSHHVRHILR